MLLGILARQEAGVKNALPFWKGKGGGQRSLEARAFLFRVSWLKNLFCIEKSDLFF